MLPVSYLLDPDHSPDFGAWAAAGAAVWLAGLAIETVADAQKSAFRAREENRGRFVASGLWRYSRHPNYFGERSADEKYGDGPAYRDYKRRTSILVPLPPRG